MIPFILCGFAGNHSRQCRLGFDRLCLLPDPLGPCGGIWFPSLIVCHNQYEGSVIDNAALQENREVRDMGKDKSGADGEEFAEDWGICEMPWQMAFSINICQEKLTLETAFSYV